MRRKSLVVLAISVVVLSAAVVWAATEGRYRYGLSAARAAIGRHDYAEAGGWLEILAVRRPRDGEVHFLLGLCRSEGGRPDEAKAAWERVPPDSPFAGRVAVHLARQALLGHRFAPAEALMARALDDPGPHAVEARETLVNLYKIQGRHAEARRLVAAAAGQYADALGLLKELAALGSIKPFDVDLARSALHLAYRAAPEDDRVWLGWANLATRLGKYPEAALWLDQCEKRRPDDAAVARARLDLTIAQHDAEAARRAVKRLPDGALTPAEVLNLRAWLAARDGDDERERRALADLLTLEPSDLSALDRLAELELRAGRPEEAARLRGLRGELNLAKAEYEVLLFLPDAPARAARMAALAETLRRPVEAGVLWGLVRRLHRDDPEASAGLERLRDQAEPTTPTDATVAALRRDLDGGPSRAPASAGAARMAGVTPAFADEAETAGLCFRFERGQSPLRHLPETMSGGVALLDYDGDGWLDVYCVQGGALVGEVPADARGDRLFRNRGDGTFADVTESAGIAAFPRGYGHGVAVGDIDNDGHPDLFVTRYRSYALYRNRGDGTFADVTEAMGLSGGRDWPTSAAFADLDNDGDLDLYVCHYLDWDVDNPRPCYDERKQTYVYCGPPRFRSLPDHLFRNDGGRFVDVTAEAGIVDTHGQGLGVVACDFDGDGRVDLFVANDQSANFLFRNLGGMRFEEVGALSGVASSADGQYQASMGVALGDPDGDGRPDLAVTNFYNEGTVFYRNLGQGLFADHSAETGLLARTRYLLGFGIAFLDANADGLLDLAATNGHVDDFRPSEPYTMPPQLLVGTPSGRWNDVSEAAGPPWKEPHLGRGLTTGDLDNDGLIDLVVLNQDEPLSYLRNRTEGGGHWLMLKLEGTASNRDAVGARVAVTAGGRTSTAWRFGGGSYQSAHDPRLHFGLGTADAVEGIEVTWPSGRVDRYGPIRPDAAYGLREGESDAKPLAGYGRRP